MEKLIYLNLFIYEKANVSTKIRFSCNARKDYLKISDIYTLKCMKQFSYFFSNLSKN